MRHRPNNGCWPAEPHAVARMAESVPMSNVDDRHNVLEQMVAMRDWFDPRPVPRSRCDLSDLLGTLS